MTTWRERVEVARRENRPQHLVTGVPYAAFAGIAADLDDSGHPRCRLRYADALIGNPLIPALHGGVIGGLLESAAIILLLWESEPGVVPVTVNMSFDFLRTGRPVDVLATGRVYKQGRRVANVRVEAWQDDRERPIAAAHGHFLLKREGQDG
ncbi:MAG: PaaI family thioesterase [Alphaproteobacteria bacterium]|nr:PaaI family thioesterase [Alphaproteobacteria bacterium]